MADPIKKDVPLKRINVPLEGANTTASDKPIPETYANSKSPAVDKALSNISDRPKTEGEQFVSDANAAIDPNLSVEENKKRVSQFLLNAPVSAATSPWTASGQPKPNVRAGAEMYVGEQSPPENAVNDAAVKAGVTPNDTNLENAKNILGDKSRMSQIRATDPSKLTQAEKLARKLEGMAPNVFRATANISAEPQPSFQLAPLTLPAQGRFPGDSPPPAKQEYKDNGIGIEQGPVLKNQFPMGLSLPPMTLPDQGRFPGDTPPPAMPPPPQAVTPAPIGPVEGAKLIEQQAVDDALKRGATPKEAAEEGWNISNLALALLPAIGGLAGYMLGGKEGAYYGGAAGFSGMSEGYKLEYDRKTDLEKIAAQKRGAAEAKPTAYRGSDGKDYLGTAVNGVMTPLLGTDGKPVLATTKGGSGAGKLQTASMMGADGKAYQVEYRDGKWVPSVTEDGSPIESPKGTMAQMFENQLKMEDIRTKADIEREKIRSDFELKKLNKSTESQIQVAGAKQGLETAENIRQESAEAKELRLRAELQDELSKAKNADERKKRYEDFVKSLVAGGKYSTAEIDKLSKWHKEGLKPGEAPKGIDARPRGNKGAKPGTPEAELATPQGVKTWSELDIPPLQIVENGKPITITPRGVAIDKQNRQTLVNATSAYAMLRRKYTTVANIMAKYPPGVGGLGSRIKKAVGFDEQYKTDKTTVQAAVKDALIAYNKMAGLGVLQPSDIRFLEQVVGGDPFSEAGMGNQYTTVTRLKELVASSQKGLFDEFRLRTRQDPNDVPPSLRKDYFKVKGAK